MRPPFTRLPRLPNVYQTFSAALSAGSISGCIQCEAGRADLDSDSTTVCDDCSVGEYAVSGSSTCISCSSLGQFDGDRDPSTPCSDTDICLQICSAGTQDGHKRIVRSLPPAFLPLWSSNAQHVHDGCVKAINNEFAPTSMARPRPLQAPSRRCTSDKSPG